MQFYIAVAYQDPNHLIPIAKSAEAAGFGGLILSDHVLYPETLKTPYPYTRDGQPRWQAQTPWPDPFVTIGALAAVTTRLQFLTSIYVLPLRHPILAAKTIATAAVLSQGRVTLGVGAGWMREEFQAVGAPFPGRGDRLLDAVQIMQKLWKGEPVGHESPFYTFDPVQMQPVPPAPIRIYGGGLSAAALRRAAHHFDGWASEIQTAQEIADVAHQLRTLRKGTPREHERLGLCAAIRDCVDLASYHRAAEMGVTELITVPWLFYGDEDQSLDQKCQGIQRFGETVIAPLRDTVYDEGGRPPR